MRRETELAALAAAIRMTVKKLGDLAAENRKLKRQLGAAKKAKTGSSKASPSPDENAQEISRRLGRLEKDLESLLAS